MGLVWEVLILAFGILYYGSKATVQKVDVAAGNAAKRSSARVKDAWVEKYTNAKLEEEMLAYVREPGNYDRVRKELEPILEEVPVMKKRICFGEKWYKSNLYSSDLSRDATDIMLIVRGVVPGRFINRVTGFRTESEIEFFRWSVKTLRETAGIKDPVALYSSDWLGEWKYDFQPLHFEQEGWKPVSDDEIVPKPKKYTGSAQPTHWLPES